MLFAFLLAQMIQGPAVSPPRAVGPAPDPATLSLVVADSVSQTDPRPLCARPDCTAMFLTRWKKAVTLAGPAIGATFAARYEMGSPYNMPYRLVMIVERAPGREAVIRATAGFHYQTKLACLPTDDTAPLRWTPLGEGVTVDRRGQICVKE